MVVYGTDYLFIFIILLLLGIYFAVSYLDFFKGEVSSALVYFGGIFNIMAPLVYLFHRNERFDELLLILIVGSFMLFNIIYFVVIGVGKEVHIGKADLIYIGAIFITVFNNDIILYFKSAVWKYQIVENLQVVSAILVITLTACLIIKHVESLMKGEPISKSSKVPILPSLGFVILVQTLILISTRF